MVSGLFSTHLSKILEKKELFDSIAARCDDCRVKAGIHYKSDGIFKEIVLFLKLKLIKNLCYVCSINMMEEKPKTIY